MRRIVSFVWNDISTIQKIGEHEEDDDDRQRDAAKDALDGEVCSMALLPRLAAGAFAQPQPVLDEDVREEIGDRPEDHHQRRGAPTLVDWKKFR